MRGSSSAMTSTPVFVYLAIATVFATAMLVFNNNRLSDQAASSNIHQPGFISEQRQLRVPATPPTKEEGVSTVDDRAENTSKEVWETEVVRLPTNTFYFENPTLAYKVLSKLDIFEPVEDSYFSTRVDGWNKYDEPWMGLKNDDYYCNQHRAFILENPEAVFDEINFITGASPGSLMRSQVMPLVGQDVQPYIGSHLPRAEKEKFTHDLSLEANVFFGSTIGVHKHIGKHFACLSQAVNHIPGHYSLNRKDFVAESAIEYGKGFKGKPQCFSHDKFFPETWLLYEKEPCQEFFQKFNSPEYQKLKEERKIVYIRKVAAGSHRGNGVFPVTQEEEDLLRTTYKNGDLCGKVSHNYIVQHFIHNPLLLQGRKFDFRMYMLIASTNPMIVFYHDGFLRVSLANYEADSNDKKVLLTNLALNKQIYDEVKAGNLFNGMDEEALKVAQQWSFDRLKNYLLYSGVINDPDWLDNYLRPELKKAMVHLVRMSSYSFLKRSSVYELYGVDFMLDQNLNVWFIEANSGPAFGGYSQPMEKFIVKMLQDHFEIVVGLIRSRMKRAFNYVNRLIKSDMVNEDDDGNVEIKDLKQRITEFKAITKNYFELEFEPSDGNGFSKIMDENFYGVKRYEKLLPEECV